MHETYEIKTNTKCTVTLYTNLIKKSFYSQNLFLYNSFFKMMAFSKTFAGEIYIFDSDLVWRMQLMIIKG